MRWNVAWYDLIWWWKLLIFYPGFYIVICEVNISLSAAVAAQHKCDLKSCAYSSFLAALFAKFVTVDMCSGLAYGSRLAHIVPLVGGRWLQRHLEHLSHYSCYAQKEVELNKYGPRKVKNCSKMKIFLKFSVSALNSFKDWEQAFKWIGPMGMVLIIDIWA